MLLTAGAAGILVLAFLLYVRFGFPVFRSLASAKLAYHPDFETFRLSAVALWEGNDVYRGTGARLVNLNPPIWAILFSPLVPLEPLIGFRALTAISTLLAVGSFVWLADELRLRSRWTGVGMAALLLSAPLHETLALGQLYLFLFAALVAAWILDRQGSARASGAWLGLTAALKPSLLPILLWPALRREWGSFVSALVAAAALTLVGLIAVGPSAMAEYLTVLGEHDPDGRSTNASLPAAAARLFTDNDFARVLVEAPWAVTASLVLGLALLALTAAKVGGNRELGLWALMAASLLASPIAWRGYLLLLVPGVVVLLAKRRESLALLLLAALAIPNRWTDLWTEERTVVAPFALTLNLYILLAYWIAFCVVAARSARA